MKKLLSILVSLMLLLAMLPLGAVSVSAGTYGDLTYTISSGEVTITACSWRASGSLTIPSTIAGYPVTTIGEGAFSSSDLTMVTIPDSVTTIGRRAFSSCYSLSWVTIPNSVTTIGENAFAHCKALTQVTIPDSVTTIGEWAFAFCEVLVAASIGNGVATIETYTFASCDSLRSVTLGDSVTTIQSTAFSSCAALRSVTMGDRVASIGNQAFHGCTALANVYYGGTEADRANISIGILNDPLRNATWHCAPPKGLLYKVNKSRETVTITGYTEELPSELIIPSVIEEYPVTTIDDNAFFECPFTAVTIPNSVTIISKGAFSCSGLESVHIPANVAYIADDAFRGCNLNDFTVDTNNTAYSSLNGVLFSEGEKTLIAYPAGAERTEYTIPDSVTTIGQWAFFGASLDSLTIPTGIKSIGSSAFETAKLTDVYYGRTKEDWATVNVKSGNDNLLNATWHYHDHVYSGIGDADCNDCGAKRNTVSGSYWSYDYNTHTLTISGTGNVYTRREWMDLQKDVVIFEEGITSVSGDSFVYTYGEVGVLVIPSTMTSCRGECFMVGARTIILNDAPVAKTAHTYDSAGYLFFQNTTVLIADSMESWGGQVTSSKSYDGLASVNGKLYKVYTKENFHEFVDAPADRFNGTYCRYCRMPKDGAPKGLKYTVSNGEVTITGCDTSVSGELIIPAIIEDCPVTTIGYEAFYGCSGLTSIVIPNSVTTLETGAFRNCPSVTSIYIGSGVTSIGKFAFRDNTALTSIVIPGNVTSIGEWAFNNCKNLTTITIPAGLTEVVQGAFYQCYKLTDVYYGGTEEDRANIAIGSDNEKLLNATWHYHEHVYDTVCDTDCNDCGRVREVPHVYDNACDFECNVCGFIREVPDHVYSDACDTDCNICGFTRVAPHVFDNDCDDWCDNCGLVRDVPDHVYDNACDADCNVCGYIREVSDHVYDHTCDADCNECGFVREVGDHEYDHACDADCNVCGVLRQVPDHVYDSVCDYDCNVCSALRSAPHNVSHMAAKEPTCTETGNIEYWYCVNCGMAWLDESCTLNTNLKAVVLPMIEHTYSGVCDTDCNVCGGIRGAEPHTYDNACDFECNVCGFGREVGDHVYDNACDIGCNICGSLRDVPDHVYDNACDVDCNVCGTVREVGDHVYNSVCDRDCNVCGAVRMALHEYDSVCDEYCNLCSAKRKAEPHTYDHACDTDCNQCGAIREVEPHPYVGKTTQAATCIADGVATYTCSICDDSYTETIPALGHDAVTDPAVASTCTATGLNEGSHCARCGETLTAQEVTPALGHVYDNACDVDCNACSATRQVPDHAYDNGQDTTCNECGHTRIAFGDVNADGNINNRDLAELQRYVNEWDVAVDRVAADVDLDGRLNNKDYGLLQRYLNGWDVIMG